MICAAAGLCWDITDRLVLLINSIVKISARLPDKLEILSTVTDQTYFQKVCKLI